jgi:PAS domain S-box-containing protein
MGNEESSGTEDPSSAAFWRSVAAETEAKFRTILEHAPEAIVILDVDQRRLVAVNGNACRLFGYPAEAMLEKDPLACGAPVEHDGTPSAITVETLIDTALMGGVPCFEWIQQTGQGADIRCEVRLVKLPSAARRLVRGSIIDVTERRRIEEHLRECQKMDALGHLAAGIAHDFNNLLSVIGASAQMVMASVGHKSEAAHDAEAILDAARRGAVLTGQLMSFTRGQGVMREIVDLNCAVRSVTSMARRVISRAIDLTLALDSRKTPIRINRGQLEQVILNLLLNSRDAMDRGKGSIVITTECREDCVLLRVDDTGMGMSEETRRRIFEPFFTTKERVGGTGLGLSTVYAIVADAGGVIGVTTAVGQGTTFEIRFPLIGANPITRGSEEL